MVLVPRHVWRNHVVAIAVIAFGVSFVAHAEDSSAPASTAAAATDSAAVVAPAADQAAAPAPSAAPAPAATAAVTAPQKQFFFRGSSLSYGHSATAMTFAPGADPYYNPTWAHAVSLAPEVHFSDLFFARGRMSIAQELTLSDETSRKHEVEVSDVFLDLATKGYGEKVTGLRLSGDVRFTLPTSKLSQMKTQVLNIGPSVALSRKFSILSGLSLAYSVRPTVHFNQYTTGRVREPTLAACIDIQQSIDCAQTQNTGGRNAFLDLTHGASVGFQPIDAVSIDVSFLMTRAWLYRLSPTDLQSTQLQAQAGTDSATKDLTRFVLAVSWQFSQPVGVSLTALTIGNQLGPDGRYAFPLFNRNTVLYLDLNVDVEGTVSKLF